MKLRADRSLETFDQFDQLHAVVTGIWRMAECSEQIAGCVTGRRQGNDSTKAERQSSKDLLGICRHLSRSASSTMGQDDNPLNRR